MMCCLGSVRVSKPSSGRACHKACRGRCHFPLLPHVSGILSCFQCVPAGYTYILFAHDVVSEPALFFCLELLSVTISNGGDPFISLSLRAHCSAFS